MNLVRIHKPVNRYYANNLVNNLLDQLWSTDRVANTSACTAEPSVNIYETKNNFKLEFLVPGYDKNEIEILVDKKQLVVKSDYKETEKTAEYESAHIQFSKSGFEKRYELSDKLNADAICADFKNGILTIIIPKLEEEKQEMTRKIEIA